MDTCDTCHRKPPRSRRSGICEACYRRQHRAKTRKPRPTWGDIEADIWAEGVPYRLAWYFRRRLLALAISGHDWASGIDGATLAYDYLDAVREGRISTATLAYAVNPEKRRTWRNTAIRAWDEMVKVGMLPPPSPAPAPRTPRLAPASARRSLEEQLLAIINRPPMVGSRNYRAARLDPDVAEFVGEAGPGHVTNGL